MASIAGLFVAAAVASVITSVGFMATVSGASASAAASASASALSISAAGADSHARQACDAAGHGSLIALVCVGSPASPGKDCCASVLQAAKGGLIENVRSLSQDSADQASHPPPPPAASTSNGTAVAPPPPTQTAYPQPLVVIVPPKERQSTVWPWVVLALGAMAFTVVVILICCFGCGMIIRLVTQLGMWIFNSARNSRNESARAASGVASNPYWNQSPAVASQPEGDIPLIILSEDSSRSKKTQIAPIPSLL